MSLTCPYCHKTFAPEEILFYTDTTTSNYFRALSSERSVAQTGSVVSDGNVTNFTRVRQSSVRRGIVRSGAVEQTQEAQTAAEAEEKKEDNAFPLGKSVEDLPASEFLKEFGAGSLFRFQRTATFYGIKNHESVSEEEDTGYGYVDKWEDEGNSIPLVLYIPSKKKRLTERVCPRCHCDIPKDYFTTTADHRHVAALAGCTSAGKTQFITVSLRDLVEASFHSLKLGSIEWTVCSRWFHDLYVQQYTSKDGNMDGTKKEFNLFPLMLRVTTADDQTHFISFIDCSGEYANNMEFAANQRGFEEASILLLMIDCAQLFPDEVELREGELACILNYENATKPLKEFDLCPNLKNAVIVLTKCDAIIGEKGGNTYIHGQTNAYADDSMACYNRDMTCHRGSIDLATIRRIDTELNAMLDSKGESGLEEKIAKDLNLSRENVTMLAVSTYCWIGNELVSKPEEKTGHHRIVEPILLAMYEWGILPGEEKEYIPVASAQPEPIDEPRKKGWKLFGGR